MNKIEYLEAVITDAERRIGSYISMGGKDNDNYILKQIEIIFQSTEEINQEINKPNT